MEEKEGGRRIETPDVASVPNAPPHHDRWQQWWEPAPLSVRANSGPLCETRWRTRRHLPSPPWTHGHKGWPQVDTERQTQGTLEPDDHSKDRKTRTRPRRRWRKKSISLKMSSVHVQLEPSINIEINDALRHDA